MWDRIRRLLSEREAHQLKRTLKPPSGGIDFSSNDYLGLSKIPVSSSANLSGSGGSRLIQGNHTSLTDLETNLAERYRSESALLFPSGYAANHALFSMLNEAGYDVLYDALIHASIRHSLGSGKGKKWSFHHNDIQDLASKLERLNSDHCVVVTEGVFSMDGDFGKLEEISALKRKHDFGLVVDEAHSTGIYGDGIGYSAELDLLDQVDIRIHTFGKAMGFEGAIVVGEKTLVEGFANFSKPFIYTTAPSETFVQHIDQIHARWDEHPDKVEELNAVIEAYLEVFDDVPNASKNRSQIQYILVPGNENCKHFAGELLAKGNSVVPILSPTVPKGQERIRICLHSYNTAEEIVQLKEVISYLQSLT